MEKQIKGFVKKRKHLIATAFTEEEVRCLYAMWIGFLNGLKLTGAIKHFEYMALINEIDDFRINNKTA